MVVLPLPSSKPLLTNGCDSVSQAANARVAFPHSDANQRVYNEGVERSDGSEVRGRETVDCVSVYRFSKLASSSTVAGHILEYFFAMLSIGMMSIYVLIREGFDIIHV